MSVSLSSPVRRATVALALVTVATLVAAPSVAQVVIRERVEVRPPAEVLPVVLAAEIEPDDAWSFEAGGELRLRVGPLLDRYGFTSTTSATQCGSPSGAAFTFTIHGADGDRVVGVPIGAFASVTSSYPTDVCPGNGTRTNARYGPSLFDVGRVEADETVSVTYSVAGASGPVDGAYFPAIDDPFEYEAAGDDGLEKHVYAGIPSTYHPSGGSTIGPVAAVFDSDSLETEVTFSEPVVSYGGTTALGVDREYRPSALFEVRLTDGAEFGTIRVETADGPVEGDAIANVRYSLLEAGAVTFVADGDFPSPGGLDATVAVSITATSVAEQPEARGSLTVRAVWYDASADPNPVGLGAATVLAVEAVDEAGPVGLDPATPVTLYAYTVDAVAVTLENTRTGEADADQLTVPLQDVLDGAVRVRTEALEDEPPPALTAARSTTAEYDMAGAAAERASAAWGVPRTTGRATMARDRARAGLQRRLARQAARLGAVTAEATAADGEDDAYVLVDVVTHNDPEAEDYAIYGWVDLTVQMASSVIEILSIDDIPVGHVNISLWENAYTLLKKEPYGLIPKNDNITPFAESDVEQFYVRVSDPSKNTDPDEFDYVVAIVTSEGAGVNERPTPITLWETGRDTGVFKSPSQILVSRDHPIRTFDPPDPLRVTDDDYALYTPTDALGQERALVGDDTDGDPSHMAVAGGTFSATYGETTTTLPVCSPGDVGVVNVRTFTMAEPFFDLGYYNEDGEVVNDNIGEWDHVDADGDGFVDEGEKFETYVEISAYAGTGQKPRTPNRGDPRTFASAARGATVTSGHHSAVLDRARISWDQACLRVEATAPVLFDPGPNYFYNAFYGEAAGSSGSATEIDAIFRQEERPIFDAVNSLTSPGDLVAVYAVPIRAHVLNPADRTLVDQVAGGVTYYEGSWLKLFDDILGGRTYMLIDPTTQADIRVLAHELGHALTPEGDPLPGHPLYGQFQYFFPQNQLVEDHSVGRNRRIPRTSVEAARRSPLVDR